MRQDLAPPLKLSGYLEDERVSSPVSVDGDGEDDHGRHADEEQGTGAPQQEHQTGLLRVLAPLLARYLTRPEIM